MSVKFVIDSACDLLPKEAKKLEVTLLPLNVAFGDKTYEDAVTISHEEFYRKLAESKELPTTSQISPAVFEDTYKRLTQDGSSVIVITISSKLSGTYQSARIAAEGFDNKVFVVDSLTATIGQQILLRLGLELANQGLSAEEIVAQLDSEKLKIRVIALIDTLEYLKKGGRISATAALAGGLLAIKPAIEVKDGEVVTAGTARGVIKGFDLVGELIDKYGGVNFNKPYALVYSGAEDELLQKFIEHSKEIWQDRKDLPIYSLGCAIGTHIGPGAYGVAFFEE